LKTAVVTCFFNAQNYASRLENYALFAARLKKQGITFFTIEAVFPGQSSALKSYPNVMTVACEAVLWQKESLLNALIRGLDKKFRGIIWCDADVYFENKDWFRITSRLLDRYPVVQPFEEAVRLPRGARRYTRRGENFVSFSEVYKESPQVLLKGDFARHGHTGFAWAARREVIAEHGLYDAMIAGSGDHVMAHAFAGDFDSPCIHRILANNPKHIAHFQQWARLIYPSVKGRIGSVPGRLLHLWHGETENRRYVDRNRELAGFGFDPGKHLERDEQGLWRWRRKRFRFARRNRLGDWAVRYFASRREDG
jgi:hypothetical protein